MRKASRYIRATVTTAPEGGTRGEERVDPRGPRRPDRAGDPRVAGAGRERELAAPLGKEEGPGGPSLPQREAVLLGPRRVGPPLAPLPGERRIYRLGSAVFRVWLDRLSAGAEILRDGSWVWTPIPSGSIAENPLAREVGEEEAAALDLPA